MSHGSSCHRGAIIGRVNEEPTAPNLSVSEHAACRARLESEREETSTRLAGLVRQLDAIIESCALSVSDDEHDPEGATLGFERAQVTALAGEARDHLDAVDLARERLRSRTYDDCQCCGRPIGIERLTARPVARNCVACAADTSRPTGRISSRGSG